MYSDHEIREILQKVYNRYLDLQLEYDQMNQKLLSSLFEAAIIGIVSCADELQIQIERVS